MGSPMDTKVRCVLQLIPRSDVFSNRLGIKHGTHDSGVVLQWNWHQTWKMIRNQDRAKKLEPKKVSS
jgi:hypothetical protein